MNRSFVSHYSVVSATLVLATSLGTVHAQINVPFQVNSGEGTFLLPSLENPVQDHDIISNGVATFGGEALSYSGNGRVRLLSPPDPNTGTASFDSAEPFLFDFGNGDTLQMHYGR
ncbi:hypothetical protein OAS39_13265, partial [Pirellulales bacterium]|nr:hypothetical protein [Pirellulales bacterium]